MLSVCFFSHRPGIPALKPAPIVASYLGYPGTVGAEYTDYTIADRVREAGCTCLYIPDARWSSKCDWLHHVLELMLASYGGVSRIVIRSVIKGHVRSEQKYSEFTTYRRVLAFKHNVFTTFINSIFCDTPGFCRGERTR